MVAAWLSPLDLNNSGYSQTSEQNTQPRSQYAQQQVGSSPTSADSGGAKNDAENAEAEKQRAQADLKAQQKMARWAFWMVIVSAASVLVAVAAVILVFLTWQEARKTTQAARDTLRAERAWMTHAQFKIAAIHNSRAGDQPINNGLRVDLMWKNTGRSPAIGARAIMRHQFVMPDDPVPTFEIDQDEILADVHQASPIGPGEELRSGPRVLDDEVYPLFLARQRKVFVYGRVMYFEAFNLNILRHTEICAEFVYVGMREEDDGTSQPAFTLRHVGPQNTAS